MCVVQLDINLKQPPPQPVPRALQALHYTPPPSTIPELLVQVGWELGDKMQTMLGSLKTGLENTDLEIKS